MTHSLKLIFAVVLCLLISCLLTSCEKKVKAEKLKITDTEFILEQNNEKTTISLNVKGKIKNTSQYDVKSIVVTGRCNNCSEVMIAGQWFVTQQEKREAQKDTISYLAAGTEETFRFDGIAYFFRGQPGEIPESYPEGLKVYVESFETVQD